MLLIAAQCGFQKCIGVEISQELCEVARHNARQMHLSDQIELVRSDVTEYKIQHDQTVFVF